LLNADQHFGRRRFLTQILAPKNFLDQATWRLLAREGLFGSAQGHFQGQSLNETSWLVERSAVSNTARMPRAA
jgi:hypothetical protein